MSYYLVTKGYGYYAESLSQTICVTIIGAMIPYLIKSFFETYFEKKQTINVSEITTKMNQNLNDVTYGTYGSVENYNNYDNSNGTVG